MAVIEVGLLVTGLPIYIADYRENSDNEGDNILQSALMSAIQIFAQEAFQDVMDTLTLSDMTIVFHLAIKNQPGYSEPLEIIIYAVADKQTKSITSVKKALIKAGNAISQSPNLINTLEPDKNEFVGEIMEQEFHDLLQDLDDRLDAFLG